LARLPIEASRHSGNAALAEATALSIVAMSANSTSLCLAPLAGLNTGPRRSPPSACLPLMKCLTTGSVPLAWAGAVSRSWTTVIRSSWFASGIAAEAAF
jgi:hypothetical protein